MSKDFSVYNYQSSTFGDAQIIFGEDLGVGRKEVDFFTIPRPQKLSQLQCMFDRGFKRECFLVSATRNSHLGNMSMASSIYGSGQAIIHWLHVKPLYRSIGVGADLVRAGARYARERSIESLSGVLSTGSGLLRREKFYRGLGFEVAEGKFSGLSDGRELRGFEWERDEEASRLVNDIYRSL